MLTRCSTYTWLGNLAHRGARVGAKVCAIVMRSEPLNRSRRARCQWCLASSRAEQVELSSVFFEEFAKSWVGSRIDPIERGSVVLYLLKEVIDKLVARFKKTAPR